MEKCFVFDLDGTVTKSEILPRVAGVLNLEKEMKLLTDLTISGTIPFEDSLRLRCACLRSAPIDEVREIVATIELDTAIENFIKENKDNCFIITGTIDVWLQPLMERLGCHFFCSTARVENNTLCYIDSVLHKNRPVLTLRKSFKQVIAIGDGVNDMPMFDASDVCIAYGGVHDPASALIEIADYVVFKGETLCRLLKTL